jgi:pimeloyl-ACP methyl ester carboxylesterase
MAAGGAVTKEPGTDRFAQRFQDAGFSVLAFDYRHLGESGGQPRQIVRSSEQRADLHAAIAFSRTLTEVNPARVALWGFSLSGGHVLRVAAEDPGVAAVIAQTPFLDGPVTTRAALRHEQPVSALRFTGRGLIDTARGLLGRPPLLVPLAGPPGTVALLTTPDGIDGDRALNPENRYPQWQQAMAARSALALATYRPGTWAARVQCPLLFVVCDQDQSVLAEPAVRAAGRAAQGELVRLPGGHYAPFLDAHETAVQAELAFLRRHLTERHPPVVIG